MRIYLDACSLQRPLDDRTQPRINIEAEGVLTILRQVESGKVELISSEVLEFEINRIPDQNRKARAVEIMSLAQHFIAVDDEIELQAHTLIKEGISPMDALQLASASSSKADYFCTCDDKLLKNRNILTAVGVAILSPLQLVAEVVP